MIKLKFPFQTLVVSTKNIFLPWISLGSMITVQNLFNARAQPMNLCHSALGISLFSTISITSDEFPTLWRHYSLINSKLWLDFTASFPSQCLLGNLYSDTKVGCFGCLCWQMREQTPWLLQKPYVEVEPMAPYDQ